MITGFFPSGTLTGIFTCILDEFHIIHGNTWLGILQFCGIKSTLEDI